MNMIVPILVAVVSLGVGVALGLAARRRDRARGRSIAVLEAGVANVINLLNNRLSAIGAFAGLVERGPLSARDREALDNISAETLGAAEIVRDLVHLVKPPGKSDGAAHLPALLSSVVHARRLNLAEGNIHTSLDVQPPVSMVAGRPADLKNLFQRLLRFAEVRLQNAPEPRTVTWTARSIGASVIVVQLDTGPALPAKAARDLNYFRPSDPGFAGHLELAMAQRVAESCGAGLRVEPGPGGGAEVTVTLIPGRLLEAPRPRPRPSPPGAQRGRVLVADDDAANRQALTQLLRAHGHEVVTVADGVEALDHLLRDHFDAVVVDLQMPRLGGRGVYEEVQKKTPELARRFVFVTGDDVRAASHEFLQHVPQPTVRKPYEIVDLLAAVNEVSGAT